MNRILKFWYFTFHNKVVWKGEKGGFKVTFRRFWVEVESVSGNWKARWTAAEYPYAYLLTAATGSNEDTLWGFIERMYMWSMTLLIDVQLAKDMDEAFQAYLKRQEPAKVEEDAQEEEAALEFERQVQEYVEMPRRQRRKQDRDVNGRFKKTVKDLEKSE